MSRHADQLDEWAFTSKGFGPDPQLVAEAMDGAAATMVVAAGGLQFLAVVSRFRVRDQTATLRLLPMGGESLSALDAMTLQAVAEDVRSRMLLRKLYLYVIDPKVRANLRAVTSRIEATFHHEGCLLSTVTHGGMLLDEDVFAVFNSPVERPSFTIPDRQAEPRSWEPTPLPHGGLQGDRSLLTPIADGDLLWLYEHETPDASWAELGAGVSVSEYAVSVRDAARMAFAIRSSDSSILLGRVAIFDWQPFLRRARLSVFFSPTLTPSERFAASEGVFYGILHAMNQLSLETLCIDTLEHTSNKLAGTLHRFARHDAHFVDDVIGRSGLHSSDLHSVSRSIVREFAEYAGV